MVYVISANYRSDFEVWAENLSLGQAENDCAVSASKIKDCAKTISEAESCIILLGRDFITHPYNRQVVDAARNLAYLAGLFHKESSGINLLWEYSNSQGALDMGVLPDRLPGLVSVFDSAYRTRLQDAWKASIPDKPGYNLKQILEAIDRGEIRCLYVMQQDLLANFPDRKFVEKALSKLELLAVQTSLPIQLSEMAHVVLPGASFAEKQATYTSAERRVQKTDAAIRPLGDSKPDWLILSELSVWMRGPFAHYSAQEISEEIARLVPGYSGKRQAELSLSGARIAEDKRPGADNKYQPKKVAYQPISGSSDFPLVLLTGNLVNHTGTLSSWSDNLRQVAGEAFCEVGVSDAERLGIDSGDWLLIESFKGSLKLKAKVTDRLQSGTVFIPINFPETPVNALLDKDSLVDSVKISKHAD